jgi:hypothetical protein
VGDAIAADLVLDFRPIDGRRDAGGRLRAVLPKHHLAEESKDIARVAIGFLVTMCALVMGLLIATAKTSFDTRSKEVLQAATKIVLLDRNLRQYGSEADPARQLARSRQRAQFFSFLKWTARSAA